MNYGHPLTFGTFLTPANGPPDAPVALARRSEELGYDLVTFQDHPYQPRFHDTWTLLAWVAGQTERVHLAANVLNLPLRQPAVLARAAASLDLLSGGRLDLALGAGAFWDAIQAMGGRRLPSGQAVEALGEAIDVIRGVLDAGEDTPLRFEGEHYAVDGVARGPLPLHHVPIWVGGSKPRMLRLIGRKADGWLPGIGQGYLEPGDLARGNKVIDDAAAEAGRDPSDVRRLVNVSGAFSARRGGFLHGPSEQWVEELLPLAVADGVGTFILVSDDPATLERFAREVAPALREAVDAELPAPLPTGSVRSAAVRAKRREGID
jgi:alkanesulfonate monooxygenase SsuD/methylene tetrahydromethanopterin reductase-like flavin-dependent oxidoreductase (luciferase family)